MCENKPQECIKLYCILLQRKIIRLFSVCLPFLRSNRIQNIIQFKKENQLIKFLIALRDVPTDVSNECALRRARMNIRYFSSSYFQFCVLEVASIIQRLKMMIMRNLMPIRAFRSKYTNKLNIYRRYIQWA